MYGEGKECIRDLEIPYNSNLADIMKIFAYHISKEDLFSDRDDEEEKKRITVKLIDLLMDMIKTTWGFFFNELIHNPKCEDLIFCRNKLKIYLKELELYIPRNISNINEELKHLKKLFNKFNWKDGLIIGLVTFVAIGLSTFYFPEFLPPLVFGAIEITSDILEALRKNEKINWAKIFLSMGKAGLEGIISIFFGEPGEIVGKIILNPLEGFLKAKINRKNYNITNVVDNILDGIFEEIGNKIGEILSKHVLDKIKYFVKILIENSNLKNKKLFSEISKGIGSLNKRFEINKCAEKILENVISNECESELKLNKIAILEVFEKITGINLVKDCQIENRIFNKEEGDNDDDDEEEEEEEKGLSNSEKGIASEFLLNILQSLSEQRKNINVGKRLRNLINKNK